MCKILKGGQVEHSSELDGGTRKAAKYKWGSGLKGAEKREREKERRSAVLECSSFLAVSLEDHCRHIFNSQPVPHESRVSGGHLHWCEGEQRRGGQKKSRCSSVCTTRLLATGICCVYTLVSLPGFLTSQKVFLLQQARPYITSLVCNFLFVGSINISRARRCKTEDPLSVFLPCQCLWFLQFRVSFIQAWEHRRWLVAEAQEASQIAQRGVAGAQRCVRCQGTIWQESISFIVAKPHGNAGLQAHRQNAASK